MSFMAPRKPRSKSKKRDVVACGVLKVQADYPKLARALLEMAKEQRAARLKAESGAPTDDASERPAA